MSTSAPSGFAPLAAYEIHRGTEPEGVEEHCTTLLSPHRLRPVVPSPLDASIRAANLPGIAMYYLTYGPEVVVTAPELEGYVALTLPLSGRMAVAVGARERHRCDHRGAAVLQPCSALRLQHSPGFAMLCLRIETAVVAATVSSLTGAACTDAPHFDIPTTTGVAAALHHSARTVHTVLDATAPGRLPTAVATRLQEQVLTTLLLTQRHSWSEALLQPNPRITRGHVRLAVDLLEAEHQAELTIAGLARRVGVSLRALETGFRDELGRTPREFAVSLRLRRAHEDLVRATRGTTTVTDVALRWGFAHLGRFAASYRRTYGQPPSQTLRAG